MTQASLYQPVLSPLCMLVLSGNTDEWILKILSASYQISLLRPSQIIYSKELLYAIGFTLNVTAHIVSNIFFWRGEVGEHLECFCWLDFRGPFNAGPQTWCSWKANYLLQPLSHFSVPVHLSSDGIFMPIYLRFPCSVLGAYT